MTLILSFVSSFFDGSAPRFLSRLNFEMLYNLLPLLTLRHSMIPAPSHLRRVLGWTPKILEVLALVAYSSDCMLCSYHCETF